MDNFKIIARGIILGNIAAEMHKTDYFNALEVYKDYVKSYKEAGVNRDFWGVVVSLSARRDTKDFEIWDIIKAEIC